MKRVPLIPNWKVAAKIHIMAFEAGTPEGRLAAKDGIMDMAEKFDLLIAKAMEAGIVSEDGKMEAA